MRKSAGIFFRDPERVQARIRIGRRMQIYTTETEELRNDPYS